jgi:tripeptidyl-peptidase-1
VFSETSDPQHESYGNFLTQDEVTQLVEHPQIGVVEQWLRNSGAQKVDVGVHRDSIEVEFNVEDAEKMLHTKFGRFSHTSFSSVEIYRAVQSYSVPADIAPLIRIVANVLRFPKLGHKKVVTSSVTSTNKDGGSWPVDCKACGSNKVTPGVLQARYNIPVPSTNRSSTMGSLAVAEFQGQAWDQADLYKFSSACGLQNFTVDIPGNAKQSGACKIPILGVEFCGEALLDIEYAKAIAGNIPLSDIYSGTYSLLNWAKTLEAMPDGTLPLVHSVSYGNDEKQQTGQAFMESCNMEFQKIGVRGVSILFASGDQGVEGREGGGARFHPDFPAGSPFITGVGGTDFAVSTTIGDEKAWSDGGGGFSDAFGIPSWQASAVATYKTNAKSSLPPASYWNNTGRGYPDVAALAGEQNPYCIGVGSMLQGIAGTSAASPVVAAIFARLNEIRLQKGGKPMGFLNPWIYQNADAFNDVTQGTNTGGGKYGFTAVAGWDPATGVGTPNFTAMVAKM